ncbi:MAG: hypothetical protein ABIZ91_18780 [Gemmatimonadaceae bacterium]
MTSAPNAPDSVVHAEMRHVSMHVESGIVLHINRLRGQVLSTRRGAPPALNDKASMIIAIESGDISIDTASLSTLLNRHVFGYRKSPLRKLHARVDGDQLELRGDLHKLVWLPFRIRATPSLTQDGMIRVHPTSIRVLGLGVTGFSKSLGGMSGLLKLEPGHGARTDGDDLLLDPSRMLPPPTIRGRLSSIAVEPGGLRQRFGASDSTTATPRGRPGSRATNYMYFHGGTLQFGKLTMRDSDLEIVDANPGDPFDYSLDRYLEHLVAGHSNTTMVDGLIVVMPDVGRLKRADKP